MARVKDTTIKTGPATIPAAGKKEGKQDKPKKTKTSKATDEIELNRASTSKVASDGGKPASKAGRSKKIIETDAVPNETGHPIGVETADESNTQAEKPKKSKGKSKKVAQDADELPETSTKVKKSKAIEAKPIESTLNKAAQVTAEATTDAAKEIKARATKAKKQLDDAAPVKETKRKSAAIADAVEETVSKKQKNTTGVADKPVKKSTKAGKAEKETKSKDTSEKGRKRKATEDEDTITVESPGTKSAKKQKNSGKQAGSGILETVKSAANAVVDAITGGQTSIVEDVANLAEDAIQSKPKGKKSAFKSKKEAKSAVEPTEAEVEVEKEADRDLEEGEEDEWEPEDDVAQLITGFESASEDEESGDEGFKQGKAIPKPPKQKALSAAEQKGKSGGPGVIYVGRVPHGFHEHEMRQYFSQFGDVNHVRLSRSKKTGRSKHYAFLEFKSEEVARIAAKTMDKYLLFGHILRCTYVPQEQVHPSLWKGADRRFKSVPWAKIEGRKLTAPKGRTQWSKKVEKESRKRASKADKLKELGYDFVPTKLTGVESVPTQSTKQIENGSVLEEEKTIVVAKDGDSVVVTEEVKIKKTKKAKKADKPSTAAAESTSVQSSPEDGKRVKKPSKRALEASEPAPEVKKAKKTKKDQKTAS